MNHALRSLRVVGWTLLLSVTAPAATIQDKPSPIDIARQLNRAFIDVAETVTPAVVVISVAHQPDSVEFDMEDGHPLFEMLPEEFRKRLEQQRERRQREKAGESNPDSPAPHREPVFDGQGSGIVLRKEGYILTNRHVVDGAERIKVRFQDGEEFEATLQGADAQSDLAVLKIDPAGRTLPLVRFGDSSKVRVGEFAIAIGAPLELDYSVTFGHISAKGRNRIIDDPSMDQDFLQTDANINPGNSGGPLVNIEGEVIGINTLIRGMRTGIGFAIPSNLVREVADQLIANGRFVRGYLGVRIRGLRESKEYRDSISGVKDGVVVFGIPAQGPAAKSDLKAGDVITAVDGRSIATPQDLKNEVRGKKIGSTVMLDVHRFGKDLKIAIQPEAWPDPADATPVLVTKPPADAPEPKAFGLTVENLTRDLAKQFGVEKSSGVIVTEVENDSVAEEKGLQPGDIITEINHKPVTSVKQFKDALSKADRRKGILLQFTSKGASQFEILREGRR